MRLPALFVPAVTALTTSAISLAQAPAYGPGPADTAAPPPGTERTSGYAPPSTTGYTPAQPVPPGATPASPAAPPPAASPPAASPPAAPPSTVPSPAAPPRDSILQGQRRKDAHVDRVIIVPTAETHPEGTFYITAYELVLPQLGYAVSDRTQITLTGSPPFGDEGVFLLDATLKTVLVRDPRFRLAAMSSISGLVGMNEGNFFIGRVGAVAQFCFDAPCRSSASLASSTILAGPGTITHTGLGFIWRLSRAFAFLFEANTFTPLTKEAGRFNAILLGPGARLSWDNFGADLAFEWVADAEVEEGENVPVVPIIALTYRFLP